MSTMRPTLVINQVWRGTTDGNVEALDLSAGVNLVVGGPNTGKTKWLETIDYLLGDSGEDPYSVVGDDALAQKYEVAGLDITIGTETFAVERRWRESGGKGKVWLGDQPMSARDFQHFLMDKLAIPVLAIPTGNPYSGRTWPELSFRTLLPHFYRPQGAWSALIEKQSEDTVRSSVQLFVGLAEHLYTEDYHEIVRLRLEIQRLEARRDQFSDTVSEVARDFLDEDQLTLTVTDATLNATVQALEVAYANAVADREAAIRGTIAHTTQGQGGIVELTARRATLVAVLSPAREELARAEERLKELRSYRKTLTDESDRFRRAESAHQILADLRITHCPACSQAVRDRAGSPLTCFLCHQRIDAPEIPDELAKQRVDYERVRLVAETSEADQLMTRAEEDVRQQRRNVEQVQGEIQSAENELAPARQQFSALIQEQVSGFDKQLGALAERLKQVRRLVNIFAEKQRIDIMISELQKQLQPILDRNRELARSLDYADRAAWLEDGMNEYLTAVNTERARTWRHQPVHINLTQNAVSFHVGKRRWDVSLGGTDSLYYLMAYHYALLTLIKHEDSHFPGVVMIDFPAEFAGAKIGDSEDFVVQPFIDLLDSEEFERCQLIVTGPSFSGLKGVNRITLKRPYIT